MELNVYHEPDNDLIIIETGIPQLSTFKLFDGFGRMVLIKEISDKESLSVKNFEAGIYHYKLVSDTRLQVGKLRL
jgi:hypothetical protein